MSPTCGLEDANKHDIALVRTPLGFTFAPTKDGKVVSPEAFHELLPALEETRAKVKELGLWTPQVPEAWGGLGLSLAEFGRVSA